MQPEHCPHLGSSPGLQLPDSGSLLDPANDLFDPLSGVDGLGLALMASSAAIRL